MAKAREDAFTAIAREKIKLQAEVRKLRHELTKMRRTLK